MAVQQIKERRKVLMKLMDFLFFIDRYNRSLFDIPVEKQLAYLNSFELPSGDIDRSYKQYKCQQLFSPWWIKTMWFVISIFAIPFVIVLYYIKGRTCDYERSVQTIAEDKNMKEVIPRVLTEKYDIHHIEWNAGCCLLKSDLDYIFSKVLGIRQPFFILKSIMQIANYSPRITRYKPEQLIVHTEFSFCSSLLTDYCHTRNVKLINVMHGEKLYNIYDSFFHFDECYVWDAHYINMFINMKAESSQFRIALPPSLTIDTNSNINRNVYADYKYYLAEISEEEIKSIVTSMSFAKNEDKTVKYRIHPRYTDLNVLKKYVSNEEIEFPQKVNIVESICNMKCAVGSYTTVLLQSYLSGKDVILDDVTYAERYKQLKEYGYILINKDLPTLSSKQ